MHTVCLRWSKKIFPASNFIPKFRMVSGWPLSWPISSTNFEIKEEGSMKFIKRVSSSFGLVMGPLSQAAPKLRRLAVGALLAALVAYGSHGRTSLARISLGVEVDGGALSSLVDDAQAVSPLTTFPILTQQKKLTADDGATFDQFGAAVAVSGDTAVVGAPEDVTGNSPGAAYVFVRSGGVWTKQQKLTADDGAAI